MKKFISINVNEEQKPVLRNKMIEKKKNMNSNKLDVSTTC